MRVNDRSRKDRMLHPANVESDPRFPSGKWVGFFLDKRMPGKHQMEIVLTFAAGRMTGDGRDRVGIVSHFKARTISPTASANGSSNTSAPMESAITASTKARGSGAPGSTSPWSPVVSTSGPKGWKTQPCRDWKKRRRFPLSRSLPNANPNPNWCRVDCPDRRQKIRGLPAVWRLALLGVRSFGRTV